LEEVAAAAELATELAALEVDDADETDDWLATELETGVVAAATVVAGTVVVATTVVEPAGDVPAAVEAGAADAVKQVASPALIVKVPEGLVRPRESRMTSV